MYNICIPTIQINEEIKQMIRSQKYNGFTQQQKEEGSFAPLPHCGTPTVLYGPHFGPSSVVGTTKALAVCHSSFSCGLGLAWLSLRGSTTRPSSFFVKLLSLELFPPSTELAAGACLGRRPVLWP